MKAFQTSLPILFGLGLPAPVSGISPWTAAGGGCVNARNVWCVQN